MPGNRRSSEGGARRGRAAAVASILGSLVGVLGVAFVVRLLIKEWDDASAAIRHARAAPGLGAVAVGLLGMTWIGVQWGAVLRAFGVARVHLRLLLRSYFIGQLGKYVPGGVWPVIGRAELLVRTGVARRAAYPSVGLSMVTTYIGAVVLTSAVAPLVLSETGGRHAWVVVFVPLGLVCLHPSVLGRVIRLGERMLSRGEPTPVPPWGVAITLVLRHIPAWVLISLSTYLVARSLQIDCSLVLILFATPIAWAAGLAAVPVPGGVGVRETVFVAMTAGGLDASAAATIAVTARLLFVGVDLLAAGIAGLAVPIARRSTAI